MNIIIAGGRDFLDLDKAKSEFFKYVEERGLKISDVTIVSGKARGADTCGANIALEYKINLIQKPADWDTWGKSAGYRRNTEMADISHGLLAFWDGKSKGTKHMIDIATKANLIVEVVMYGQDILTFTTPETRWLSNMAYVDIYHKGIFYPSTENFYQAMKYSEVGKRVYIASLTPSEAKRYSRENIMTSPVFEERKMDIMLYAQRKKYSQEPFKSKLLSTANAHLEEGNWWNDTFWGVDVKTREGENNLGKLIMKVRNEIKLKK